MEGERELRLVLCSLKIGTLKASLANGHIFSARLVSEDAKMADLNFSEEPQQVQGHIRQDERGEPKEGGAVVRLCVF